MNQRHDDDTVREQAALYALGAFDQEEALAFERHLEGCAVCAAEVESFTAVVQDLGHAVTPAPVDAAVKSKVFDRIAAEDAFRNAATVEADGLRFVRANELGWSAVDLPGISLKPLSGDVAADRVTQLVRMEAGATYPRHRHTDVEEIFLLEGDLIVSGVLMRAGDYCRAEPESVHSGIRSPNGCVFMVTACRGDELLPDAD
jgi:anti-sigma factor ChrR (cupin superfamily)